MDTRNWFRVHSFTGVITGLMLFVICWSGTFTVFAHELDWLVTPERRVTPSGETKSWGSIKRSVERAYPDGEITRMNAPRHAYSAAEVLVNLPHQRAASVFVNPYTAQIQGTTSGFSLHEFFRKFHVQLLHLGGQGNYVGYYIVMSFSFVLLVSVVSALVFYSRWWTDFFSFAAGSARQFWSSLHKSAGLWSLWFLILMALTGSWYFFEISRLNFGDGVYVYAGRGSFAAKRVPSPSGEDEDPLPLDRVLESVDRVRPDFRIRTVQMPAADGSMYVMGQADDWFIRDWGNRVYLDARTGDVLYDLDADELPLYWYWSNMADPLHFGNFAGLYSKAAWFLFGLVLCGIILTGTYLHVRRLARGQDGDSDHYWPGTWAAVTVTFLTLLAAVPYGLNTVRFFGPMTDGVRRYPELGIGVTSVIVVWIVMTIGILGSWIFVLRNPRALVRNKK